MPLYASTIFRIASPESTWTGAPNDSIISSGKPAEDLPCAMINGPPGKKQYDTAHIQNGEQLVPLSKISTWPVHIKASQLGSAISNRPVRPWLRPRGKVLESLLSKGQGPLFFRSLKI